MTVVLETEIFPISGSEVKLVLDTPAGLVHATAECEHHKATAVTLQNVPSVVILSDVETEEGIGRITSDIAYGGNFYAILPAEQAGVAIRLDRPTRSSTPGGASAPRSTSTSATGWSTRRTPASAASAT